MEKDYGHKPVLLEECLQALDIKPAGTYLDGTLGRAGHALELLRRLPAGRFVGIDRDLAAIEAARERLAAYAGRVTLLHGNFRDLGDLLREAGISRVDGMLFDLGVSSPQLDEPRRGFSYMHDAPLDMRMDETEALDAFQVVNTWSGDELRRILYEYGEERYAPRIAQAIVRRRQESPIRTTGELAEVIRSAMPAAALREKQHPAKRSFQAIRIAVNGEMEAVITFHSLEDRIVKQAMRTLATGCTCPPEFPVCVCGKKPKLRLVTRKPIVSGREELEGNPRARSAKLRVAERTEFL